MASLLAPRTRARLPMWTSRPLTRRISGGSLMRVFPQVSMTERLGDGRRLRARIWLRFSIGWVICPATSLQILIRLASQMWTIRPLMPRIFGGSLRRVYPRVSPTARSVGPWPSPDRTWRHFFTGSPGRQSTRLPLLIGLVSPMWAILLLMQRRFGGLPQSVFLQVFLMEPSVV